jgi:DNA adenine methylase
MLADISCVLESTKSKVSDLAPRIDPFLRWAGGKRRLVPSLLRALPDDIGKRKYHEVFVGAGSLFLAVRPAIAVLSDANAHLIASYEHIRASPDLVAKYLSMHGRRNTEDYYYEVREIYNKSDFSAAQAARFIYLNKACFNGIFRVNVKGDFNVPYGHKEPPLLPTHKELRVISKLLTKTTLFARPFEESLETIKKTDFVYLDPPYPPLNGTSYFTHYTSERFGERDQRTLADHVAKISARGAKIMMSNADTPLIREIYQEFFFIEVNVTRYVTCKSTKHRAAELIITNYPVGTTRK